MVWVRTPDDLMDRPDVIALGPAALCLHLAALGYSNRQLTDGRLPAGQVGRLTGDPTTPHLVAALIAAGWWTATEAGYQLVYLLDLQPTREKVERERAQAAVRFEAYRQRQVDARSNGVANGAPGPGPGPGPGPLRGPSLNEQSVKLRAADAARQAVVPPTAPRRDKRTPTQVKLAEIVDYVRAEGLPIHPTPRDGRVLKSCAAPAGLIAEAYLAAARGLWDPGGDRFLPSQVSVHMVVDRLAGFEVWQAQSNVSLPGSRFLETRYGRLVGRGPGHNVHGPGCDCSDDREVAF